MSAYKFVLCPLLLLIALPASVCAQADENPTVGVNYWKCDWSEIEQITQTTDSLVVPIVQELVDEGQISNYGLLTHEWGDEWNIVFYMTAPDTPTYMEASDELTSRLQDRHPDVSPLTDFCSEHKDNIYKLRTSTE